MAAVAAQPVFRLLGAKDLGVTEDYHTAKMPAVNVVAARRAACLAPARWRTHRRAQLEVLHSLGRQVPAPHRSGGASMKILLCGLAIAAADAGTGRPAGAAIGQQLPAGPRTTAREDQAGAHRHLFRGRLHHAAMGRHGLSPTAGKLEAELLRLERGRLRLGRGPGREHPLAPGERRTGWRQSEGDRAAGRHQQRRQQSASGRRRRGRRRRDQGSAGGRARDAVQGSGRGRSS